LLLVFDTNVYVSAFVVPGSKSDLAFRLALRGAFDLAASESILTELREKLASKLGLTESELSRVERTIRSAATIVEPETELDVLDDEPDNRILECAVALQASAIVTGDRHLLGLGAYEGVGIMTVAELLYTLPQFAEGPPSTPPISE
jgi:putative PIN family toxin of toxin-antitoxin system